MVALLLTSLLNIAHGSEHPFESLPTLRNVAVITHATPVMHWYSASAINHERIGCDIGIPAHSGRVSADEVLALCAFPGKSTLDDPTWETEPRSLRRLARRGLRKDLTGPVRDIELEWMGTWQRVTVQEMVPLTASGEGQRIATWGEVTYAVSSDGVRPLSASSAGYGLMYTDADRMAFSRFLDWRAPAALEGTSVLAGRMHYPGDLRYVQAEKALRETLKFTLLTEVDRTVPAVLAERMNEPTIPEGYRDAIRWQLLTDNVAVHIDLPVDLEAPTTVTFTVEDIAVEATLDLAAETAEVTATGPTETVTVSGSFDATLLRDGEQVAVSYIEGRSHDSFEIASGHGAPVTFRPFYRIDRATRALDGDEATVDILEAQPHMWPNRVSVTGP